LPSKAPAPRRAVVYCIVPEDLADKLHEPLRAHFADGKHVEVVVEQRWRDRRGENDRRMHAVSSPAGGDRRRVRAVEGRRIADRRATAVTVDPPGELPRKARSHADRLVFIERLEPSSEQIEDRDTARLVARIQAGEADLFAGLYLRYFDRVYSYLRMALRDAHEAEDATQQVFIQALEALERYEHRGRPFRVWLFVIVRNTAISFLRKSSRVDILDPALLRTKYDSADEPSEASGALPWISDRELLLFIERLPLAQRQVLMLRFMLDLSHNQIAAILDVEPNTVAAQQSRALRYIRERLMSVGRGSERSGGRAGMRRWNGQNPVLRLRRFVLM
jgi:RNA polymerase sigma-70 factor (ECF subfamily)